MWNLDYVTREQALKLCEVVCFGNEPTRPVQATKSYSQTKGIIIWLFSLFCVGASLLYFINFIKKAESMDNVIDRIVIITSTTLFIIANVVILILLTYYITRSIISSYKFNFARIIKYSSRIGQCFVLLIICLFFVSTMESYYKLFKIPMWITFMVILIVSIPCSILAFRYMNNRINRVISGDINFKTVRFLSRKQWAEILAVWGTTTTVGMCYLDFDDILLFITSLALPFFAADVVFTFVRTKILYKLLCLGKIDQNDFADPIIIYSY